MGRFGRGGVGTASVTGRECCMVGTPSRLREPKFLWKFIRHEAGGVQPLDRPGVEQSS